MFEFFELGWPALPMANQRGFAAGIHVERYAALFERFGDPAAILPVLTGIQYFGRWPGQK